MRMGGGAGLAVGGGMAGRTNLDFMPKTPEEAKARFQGRVSGETQRAIRIVQALVSAEADAGNYKNAIAIWEEMRPSIVVTMTPPALPTDARTIAIRLRAGDIEGAGASLRACSSWARSIASIPGPGRC